MAPSVAAFTQCDWLVEVHAFTVQYLETNGNQSAAPSPLRVRPMGTWPWRTEDEARTLERCAKIFVKSV